MDIPLLAIIPTILIVAVIVALLRGGMSTNAAPTAIITVAVSVLLIVTLVIPATETTYYPNVSGEETDDLDVFLLIGQSNAATGNQNPAEASPKPEIDRAYYFGTATDAIYYPENVVESGSYSLEGMGIYSMNTDGGELLGNIDAPFAAKYGKLSGNKVLVINGAVPGTEVSQWQNGQPVYQYAKTVFDTAMAAIPDGFTSVTLKSVLWVQGENNAYTNVDSYMTQFVAMWESIKTWDYSGQHFGSIVINQVGKSVAPNPYLAQSKLAAEYSDIYLGCTAASTFTIDNGLMGTDTIHYTQKGDNIIGTDLANCAYFEVKK